MVDTTSGNDLLRIQGAIAAVAAVDGVSMEPAALVSDLLDMAGAYGDSFEGAVESLCGAGGHAARVALPGSFSTAYTTVRPLSWP